jgi:hypothetical protein
MKSHLLFILVILIIVSCNLKKKSVEVINEYTSSEIEQLKQLVINKGDTISYQELGIAYMNSTFKHEYLFYSLIMAEKYKYKGAFFYVYEDLTESLSTEDSIVNHDIKKLALKYLLKGAELRDGNALLHLSDLYNDGKLVPKDTILGKKMREEARKICGF